MAKYKIEIPIYATSQENAEAKVKMIEKLVTPIFNILEAISIIKQTSKKQQ